MRKTTLIKVSKITGWTLLAVIGVFALLVAAFFLFFRPPGDLFEPIVWSPPPGFAVPENKVTPVDEKVQTFAADIQGPEDVVVDNEGRVYVGTQNGQIIRILTSGEAEVFAQVDGRPLGLELTPEGDLLVANHGVGLQRVSPRGEVEVLATEANGRPIFSANDVARASDGTIYLSDSSPKYNSTTLPGLASYSLYDFLEGRASGRVIRYDPRTREATEVISDLYFPNGIMLCEDESSLLVTESTRFQISRHWLTGEKRGEREMFLENIPGILDGITRDGDGRIYLPMYDRVASLERYILPTNIARQFVARLPTSVIAAREPLSGSLLVITEDGEVVQQMTGFHPSVSNIAFRQGYLLLGTLEGDSLRMLPYDARDSSP